MYSTPIAATRADTGQLGPFAPDDLLGLGPHLPALASQTTLALLLPLGSHLIKGESCE